MKAAVKEYIKILLSDRYLLILTIFMMLLAIGLAINIGFSINTSGIQRVSHYSMYGSVNRYTDQWYYPLFFAFFEVVIAVFNSIIAIKVLKYRSRSIAIMLSWFGVEIIFLGWMAARAVLYNTL